MPNIPAFIFVVWLALASSMPAVGRMQDMVLCFSSQGHFAFESEHLTPDCADVCSSSASVEDEPELVHADSDSHSCFDLMLSRIEMRPNRTRDASGDWSSGVIEALTPLMVVCAINDRAPPTGSEIRFNRAMTAQHQSLRTVILRV